MKSKKFEKKLTLRKRTVTDLNSNEMFDINGGGVTQTRVCNTCVVTCMTACELCTDIMCPTELDC